MKEIKVFENPEFGQVRTTVINNDPWFVGKDVATALGYEDTVNALKKHVDETDKIMGCQNATPSITDSLGRAQYPTWINESGVYALIFGSKLDSAKRFKHWVTSEVLPSIRKHGMYATDKVIDDILKDPDFGIELLTQLKNERQRNRDLEEKNRELAPKALFADAVATADTCILIGELAKILKQNGVNIGQNRLFEWLRSHKYLISRNGTDYNMPTQKSMEMGLFEIKERTINNPDGSVRITKTPKVTGHGQEFFINQFLGGVA